MNRRTKIAGQPIRRPAAAHKAGAGAPLEYGDGDGGSGDFPLRRFTAADAPRDASNRALRRRWLGIANAELRRTGNRYASSWTATRCILADLDYAGAEQNAAPHAPVTLAGAAGRRQRWTAGPGEGAGEIAERMMFGPDIPYDYDGEPKGRFAEIEAEAENRRLKRKAAV